MRIRFVILLSLLALSAADVFSQAPVKPITGKSVFAKPVAPVQQYNPSLLITPAYYTDNLAFFCRQEYKFEKATGINFKFRLGSVQYVDYLEGKKGALRPLP